MLTDSIEVCIGESYVKGPHLVVSLWPRGPRDLAASRAMRPKPRIALVLDVSGSMLHNMDHVMNVALATVDVLEDSSTLAILTFDTDLCEVLEPAIIGPDNRASIKDSIVSRIKNKDGLTNLMKPLVACHNLSDKVESVMLVTDGQANSGAIMTSSGLLEMARAFKSYGTITWHTFGLQDANVALNVDLLKGLSLDTNGTFRMGHDIADMSAFVGDVIADHYMRRSDGIKAKLIGNSTFTSSLITYEPVSGFVLRADKPTTLVFLNNGIPTHIEFDNKVTLKLSDCSDLRDVGSSDPRHHGPYTDTYADVAVARANVSGLLTCKLFDVAKEFAKSMKNLPNASPAWTSIIFAVESHNFDRPVEDSAQNSASAALFDLTCQGVDSNEISECRNLTQNISMHYQCDPEADMVDDGTGDVCEADLTFRTWPLD